MKISDIVFREQSPRAWSNGGKIPWNDPDFSRRMLQEHLNQNHDMASRKFARIDRHTGWIHKHVLEEIPSRILDLGCGPGFYSLRLAKRGHRCVGIDFSPASVAYAREEISAMTELPGKVDICEGNILEVDYGGPYDLAMFVFGEFNTFQQRDAEHILRKIRNSLRPGGIILLEPHTYEGIASRPPGRSWHTARGGLFSDDPYLCLTETHWDQDAHATVDKYYVINTRDNSVDFFSATHRAYTEEEYKGMLSRAGFESVRFYPSLAGREDPEQKWLCAVTAVRP